MLETELMYRVYKGEETARQLVTESNSRFTWVGREFYTEIDEYKFYWKLELYDPEIDQYYVSKREDNISMFATSWIDAKILRLLVIEKKAFIV